MKTRIIRKDNKFYPQYLESWDSGKWAYFIRFNCCSPYIVELNTLEKAINFIESEKGLWEEVVVWEKVF